VSAVVPVLINEITFMWHDHISNTGQKTVKNEKKDSVSESTHKDNLPS